MYNKDGARYGVTRGQLLEWNLCCRYESGCYCDENLDMLFKGEDLISWASVFELKIPAAGKIWLATRPGTLSLEIQKRFIDIVIGRAIRSHCLNCGVRNVEAWARAWLSNTDRTCSAVYDIFRFASGAIAYAAHAAVSAYPPAGYAAVYDTVSADIAYADAISTSAHAAACAHAAAEKPELNTKPVEVKRDSVSVSPAYVDERELQVKDLRKLIRTRAKEQISNV